MTVLRARKRLGQAMVVMALTTIGVIAPTAPALAIDGCTNEGLKSGSVDGREIRYTQSTRYSREFYLGRDDWNALGRISILADSASTVNDLHVSDVNRSTATWSGYWQPSAGQDDIWLNGHFLANYSYPRVRMVIGHEIGHALRLGHFDNRNALMHCTDSRNVTVPQTPDINKYRSIWG